MMKRCGMYGKSMLLFEVIKQYAVLYEIACTAASGGRPVGLIGEAMERYNLIAGYEVDDVGLPTEDNVIDHIEDCPDSANKMAMDFLEWVFNSAPQPEWAKVE